MGGSSNKRMTQGNATTAPASSDCKTCSDRLRNCCKLQRWLCVDHLGSCFTACDCCSSLCFMCKVKSVDQDAHNSCLQSSCARQPSPQAWHTIVHWERQKDRQWQAQAPVRDDIDCSPYTAASIYNNSSKEQYYKHSSCYMTSRGSQHDMLQVQAWQG